MNGLAVCAGVGGLELGVSLAVPGYKTVCYIEREAFCAATLVARMEDKTLDSAPVWDDLTTFDGNPWCGTVDLVAGGFPCQPWSVAGKRQGTADDRWIWDDFQRVVGEIQPAFVFIENVPGLVGKGLRIVWQDLRRLGYDVQAGLFSAAEVGAPHRRQRLFVLAHGHGHGRFGAGVYLQPGGSQQNCDGVAGKGEGVGDAACELPHWPWSPGSGRWAEPANASLVGRHAVEPAIRRVVDGDADRMDRLRALGNGVVPLVVAHAFRTLAARFQVSA